MTRPITVIAKSRGKLMNPTLLPRISRKQRKTVKQHDCGLTALRLSNVNSG
jgi:hypothetical protein